MGQGGGGKVHLEGDHSMAMYELGCENVDLENTLSKLMPEIR